MDGRRLTTSSVTKHLKESLDSNCASSRDSFLSLLAMTTAVAKLRAISLRLKGNEGKRKAAVIFLISSHRSIEVVVAPLPNSNIHWVWVGIQLSGSIILRCFYTHNERSTNRNAAVDQAASVWYREQWQ